MNDHSQLIVGLLLTAFALLVFTGLIGCTPVNDLQRCEEHAGPDRGHQLQYQKTDDGILSQCTLEPKGRTG